MLFNNNVAGSITSHGREVIQLTESKINDYFYNHWHLDFELHEKMNLKNVKQINNTIPCVIYSDTDSNFISFQPFMDHCEWQHMYSNELDFIMDLDKYRIAGYFTKILDEYGEKYGVENKHDFELERISESIINMAKKKYIQHIVYEDGIPYDRFSYIYPKGVELVRSSTPLFAREKIVEIVKYLFRNPDTFNIKELLKLVKGLRKEFDLCIPDKIDDIALQSSCTNYDRDVKNDKKKLEFEVGTHFAVKAAAYHNFLLHKNKELQSKYEFIKGGSKIKYYYTDNAEQPIFAYLRDQFPIEFAPRVDMATQFEKALLSPINSIIEPLNMPEITKRLGVVIDIFGSGF